MSYIHLIDGEKGGVGKSVVSQAIFYYCLKKLRLAGVRSKEAILTPKQVNNILLQASNSDSNMLKDPSSDTEAQAEADDYSHIPLVLIDADRTNADVEKVYEEKFGGLIKKGFFSENAKSEEEKNAAHTIFESAIGKTVIVNVPSAAKRAVESWFSVNDLFELAESQEVGAEPIKFVKWFVSNGLKDSLDIYKDSVNKYSEEHPGKMTHIFVKNNFFCDDWKLLDDQEYSQVISDNFTMDFPALDEMYSTHIRNSKLDYDDAISGLKFFKNKVIARHAVFKFTQKFSEEFAKYDGSIFKSLCAKSLILSADSARSARTVAEPKTDKNNKFDTEVVETSQNSNKFDTESVETSGSSKSNSSQEEVGNEKNNAGYTTESKKTRK